MKRLFLNILIFTFILILWHFATSKGWVNTYILPSPQKVASAFFSSYQNGELSRSIFASLWRVGIGFSLAFLLAYPLGLVIGRVSWVRKVFLPPLNFLRPIPPIAWIPLAILWLGLGNGPAYFLTTLAAFFPILINTIAGVEQVSFQHLQAARCFGTKTLGIYRHVIIPSALPYIISGCRTGFGFAWMAVVAAEMIAARSGLGQLIFNAQDLLRLDRVLMGMMVIGAIGLIVDYFFLKLRNNFLRWE